MPKDTTKSPARSQSVRHNPLHEDLTATSIVQPRKEERQKRRRAESKSSNNGYVDAQLSRKILQIAREQQDELEAEGEGGAGIPSQRKGSLKSTSAASAQPADNFLLPHDAKVETWEDESDGEDYEDEYGEEEIEEIEVNEEDEKLFNQFNPGAETGPTVSLADKILEKIAALEQPSDGRMSLDSRPHEDEEEQTQLPPKVIEVYTKVGLLLSRYKSGKLPKPFKIIPSLRNWEEILFITRPDTWSPHAVYEATKMFASNLNSNQSQKFINLILLDRVREDIAETKKLNVHLYKALKKALYKPAAFNKGFLFPLCSSGCTLREAQIVSSVLTRVSIPVLHSAAALQRLCEADYSGPTSIFIRVLLDKKYALPFKAIDAVVFHFLRFANTDQVMPVLWHQSMLSFATRYKNDITEDQRKALFELVRKKGHPGISPEVVRELEEGRKGAREEMMMVPPGLDDMDDLMDM